MHGEFATDYVVQRYRSAVISSFVHLDRSALGFAAMDFDTFVTVGARELVHMGKSFSDAENKSARLVMDKQVREALGASDYRTVLPYRAEVLFWLVRSDIPPYVEYAESEINTAGNRLLVEHLDRLELIHDNPTAHPYFSVGIWDLSSISFFVENGIDPAIANDLSNLEAA